MRSLASFVGVCVVAACLACSPAQQAELTAVENIVLHDVEQGKAIPAIETDVATLVAGQPGADVVAIVDSALTLLIDMGVVPQNFMPYAKSLAASEHVKAASQRDAGAE